MAALQDVFDPSVGTRILEIIYPPLMTDNFKEIIKVFVSLILITINLSAMYVNKIYNNG
jgi:hypothetical protein